MTASTGFSNLPEYAFPRLRRLLSGVTPGGPQLRMSIGEPRHAPAEFIGEVLAEHLGEFAIYPVNEGRPELLEAISAWLARRFGVAMGHDQIMALNGTREGLFNAALALGLDRKAGRQAVVLHPNPFYPCYRAAAIAIGAEPVGLDASEATGHLPDLDALTPELLERTTIAYLCTPSNPQGRVADRAYLARLLHLAERYDFFVFSDECYSEIWRDQSPLSALEVARDEGINPDRVLAFHSLSKRSNAPGLRSGFVAGGAGSIARLRQLRAYGGAPMPMPLQAVSARLWSDEAHVEASRARYQAKYRMSDQALAGRIGYAPPEAGFFLWLPVSDGEAAARALFERYGLVTLPGAYLATGDGAANPGHGFVRAALVLSEQELEGALEMLAEGLAPFQRSQPREV